MSGSGGRRIRLIDSLEAVEQVREAWKSAPLGRHDADIDFYVAYAASRAHFMRPHVLLVERDGSLEAMLVARVEDTALPATVGYRTLFRARVRSITLVHGGLAGVSDEIADLIVGELRATLARGDADALSLPALRTDAPLYRAATRDLPAYLRSPSAGDATHRRLELPATMDEFMQSRSKSTRDSVKRYRKKVERELGERLELRVYRDESELQTIFADTEPVAAKTYQRGLGVALADTPEQRALLEVGLRHGWFRTYVLYLDGRPVAFWPGFAYRGTFFIGTPGYEPELSEYRIGTYLQMRMIEDFCADPAISAVDYGFGDAEYKRRFGSESWTERDLLIFARRPRPIAINGARSAVMLTATGVRGLLARFGLLDRVKRAWRRRLAGERR
jgi:Acetyltransferase (GNAT) domain